MQSQSNETSSHRQSHSSQPECKKTMTMDQPHCRARCLVSSIHRHWCRVGGGKQAANPKAKHTHLQCGNVHELDVHGASEPRLVNHQSTMSMWAAAGMLAARSSHTQVHKALQGKVHISHLSSRPWPQPSWGEARLQSEPTSAQQPTNQSTISTMASISPHPLKHQRRQYREATPAGAGDGLGWWASPAGWL